MVGQEPFLEFMGAMMLISAVLFVLTYRLAIPSIVVFIGAGLLLQPILDLVGLQGLEADSEGLAMMSEFGIVLLLFLVGLELSLSRIRDIGKVAVVAGLGQVVFTAGIGFGLALLLGFNALESFFLATALTFSSTVVVVKLLGQKRELDSLYGRIAVGIFLVQDLVVIIALTILSGLEGDQSGTQLAIKLVMAGGGVFLMLLIALGASKFLARPFAWISQRSEALLIWSLCWCVAFVLGAELLHLSPEIGAFLAGVSLAQIPGIHALRHRVQPLMNFFIAIFFVTLGAQMQFAQAQELWFPALVLALFVLIGNPLIFIIIISRFGYSEKTSFKTSVTVAQISEFSFIFAALGVANGLVQESILAVVAVVGLITIITSAYMILFSDRLYELVRRTGVLRLFKASQEPDESPPPPRQGHTIVVGMNALGRHLVQALQARGEHVLAVDTDPRKLEGLEADTLLGSVEYLSVLEEANYTAAKLVISALSIEDTNTLLAYHCRQQGVPCAIHGFDVSVHGDLRALKVDHIIDTKRSGMQALMDKVRGLELI